MKKKRSSPPLQEEYEATSPDGYGQIFGGIPFEVSAGRNWELACCHCGLVHTMRIDHEGEDASGDVIRLTMRENVAATKRHRAVAGAAPSLDEAYAKGRRDGIKHMQALNRKYYARERQRRRADGHDPD